jgi:hypothetical protein
MSGENQDYVLMIPVTYCKHASKIVGVFGAILYSEFLMHISRSEFYKNKDNEPWDEWFPLSVEQIYERTSLTQEQQSEAIKMLKKHGHIDVKSVGMPAVRHFKAIWLDKLS